MDFIKNIIGENLEEKSFKLYIEILGEENFKEISEFFSFYKLMVKLEDSYLRLFQFFHKERKWEEILSFNLKTKKIEKHINKNLLLEKLQRENDYILELTEKEIKRTINIIIALLSLIIGAIVALIIINLV